MIEFIFFQQLRIQNNGFVNNQVELESVHNPLLFLMI